MKKKISIITVTKNSEKYLEKNILSVHKQKYKNYEHIIIDGKSTDKTIDIVNKYENKIKYFISEKDKGLYDAMNKGIKKSTGDIIGILNSDDIYYKKSLGVVNNYFNKYKDLDFLFGSVYKHKLLYGYYPKKIKWTFGFYSTHSVGFFIKKEASQKSKIKTRANM
jgi:glycosyltransferase involved in cell wall biosynthesis